MKKLLMMTVLVVAGFANAAQISLADARGKIDAAAKDPKVMTELMKGLSAEDQKQFLADVNAAIADLPGSSAEKAALFLNANSAAMRAAAPGNLQTLVAETFSTVSPEALPTIAERFANDLFNRDAAGADKYSDERFTKIASETMKVINARTAETDNGPARSGFAIVMFIRAAKNAIPDLPETLIQTLPQPNDRELARTVWIPPAIGQEGTTLGYEPLLAAADAGKQPDPEMVLIIAGPQHLESVLIDNLKYSDPQAYVEAATPVLDAVDNKLIAQNAILGGERPGAVGAAGNAAAGGAQEGVGPESSRPTEKDPDPPKPYNGQMTLGGDLL